MQTSFGFIRSVCLAGALAAAAVGTACEHHYYRAYDPYYNDYHVWNQDELVYYQQWCRETHRDPGRDFRKLHADEQREYWAWRHGHADHDHGHDHDRH